MTVLIIHRIALRKHLWDVTNVLVQVKFTSVRNVSLIQIALLAMNALVILATKFATAVPIAPAIWIGLRIARGIKRKLHEHAVAIHAIM
ncbi:MAG: hypothetical protein LBF37_01450 [Rickettsiales bacterium]|nr:hypothetical protein [Rickettsiales bacterium]